MNRNRWIGGFMSAACAVDQVAGWAQPHLPQNHNGSYCCEMMRWGNNNGVLENVFPPPRNNNASN